MLVSNTASLSVYTLKKICVLGFLHQVLAAISGEKNGFETIFCFQIIEVFFKFTKAPLL